MRLLAPALLAALTLILSAPALADAPAWSPTQQLNTGTVVKGGEPVPFSSGPAVGVAADGATLAAWSVARVRGQEPADVHLSAAPAGGPFAPERIVLPEAENPDLVVLPDGRALLTARVRAGSLLLAGRVDGTFGPPRPIGGANEIVTALLPTPRGALALTSRFTEDDETLPTTVREIGGDGQVGEPRDVGLGEFGAAGVAYVGGAPGAVARGADGTLVFPLGRALLVRRPDGRWERLRTPFPRTSPSPDVAVAPDGRITVVSLVGTVSGEVTSYGTVAVAEWRPGTRRFGALRRLPARKRTNALDGGPPRAWAFDPVAAYDARGRRVVGWVEDTHPDPGGEQESAVGEAILWSSGRRTRIATRTGIVSLTGRADRVLAVVADRGQWRTFLAGGRATPRALRGPSGRIIDPPVLAAGGRRTVMAWRGAPDGGIRISTLAG